MKLEKIVYGLL